MVHVTILRLTRYIVMVIHVRFVGGGEVYNSSLYPKRIVIPLTDVHCMIFLSDLCSFGIYLTMSFFNIQIS